MYGGRQNFRTSLRVWFIQLARNGAGFSFLYTLKEAPLDGDFKRADFSLGDLKLSGSLHAHLKRFIARELVKENRFDPKEQDLALIRFKVPDEELLT